ncbi:GMC family oxidoreductase [Devosia sp. A369]
MQTTSYDYVVVGSGSAGGVVAARLSENGKYSVLCLEAGTKDEKHIWTKSPLGGAFMIEDPKVNWCDYSQPNETHGNRPIYVAHGKILGGSSAINATVYNRGQKRDYNTWAQMGCTGWGYDDVLPFFKKLESSKVGSDEFRGRNGPIGVSLASKITPFYDLFIKSAQAVGIPLNPDYCGGSQFGVAMAQQASHRGFRQSTATQYLASARRRPNLSILSGAEAKSLMLEGGRCVGVRFRRNNKLEEVRATREVIVSCGAINSPKLLELSGIGNPEILSRYGIPVVQELVGVGENLRDHYGPTLKWTFTKPGISAAAQGRGWRLAREVLRFALLGKGFISQGIGTMRAFVKSDASVEDADIQLIGNPYIVDLKDGKRSMSPVEGFVLFAQVQRPESAGSVHIQSADAFTPPAINYKFLETENDRRVAVASVRKAREIVAAPPLADVIAEELLPGPKVQSDAEIIDYIRNTGATTFHFSGTCKMGKDATSVVDERLRVHGIKGLRVADASIMPIIVSGNTSIPCMMIGEKCADMVLADAAA